MKKIIRILYIEDNPADVRLVKEMLSESPGEFELETINHLSEGMKKLPTEEYDVVLLDLGLPDSKGLESFKTVFSIAPNIPFVILSGLTDENVAIKAVKDGAQSYLLKDKINSCFLVNTIKHSIERCKLLVELKGTASNLRERVKELNCLHEISKIVEKECTDIESPVRRVVDLIPPAFLNPENTAARIVIGDKEFRSSNFKETKTVLSEPILLLGERIGVIETHLLEDMAKKGAEPFSEEERDLLKSISERIGRIVERIKAEDELKKSEEKHRRLFETMAQGVVYKDRDGKVISANPSAEKITGFTLDHILGKTPTKQGMKAIHEDGSDFPREAFPAMVALKTGKEVKSQIMGVFNPLDEEYRWIDINAVPIFRPGEKKPYQVYTTFTDITQLQNSRNHINHLNRLLSSIRNINQLIVKEKDKNVLLEKVCEILVEVSGYYFVWIGFLNEENKKVIPIAKWGFENGFLDSVTITWDDEVTAKGPIGTAIKTRKACVFNDLMNNPDYAPWKKEAGKRGYRSNIAFPIIYQDTIYGTLNVYTDSIDYFYSDEIELLQEAAQDIAYALSFLDEEEKRRQAEIELSESQRKLSTLISNLPGIAYRCKIDEYWTMEFISEGCYEITGYYPEDFINNKKVSFGKTLIHPDDQRYIRDEIQNAIKEKRPYELTYRIISADGKEKWLWEKGIGIHSEKSNEMLLEGFITDITELKRAENVVKESEERYRELFENISSGVAVYEAVDDGEDFVFKDFNKAGEKIESLEKKDVIGWRLTERFPGVKEFGLFKVLQRVWRTGKPEFFPAAIYKDEREPGSWRENWVYKLPSGEIVAVYDDVTERMRAEQEIRDSEEKWRGIFENSIEAVFTVDLSGNFTSMNDALVEIMGYEKEEILGSNYKKFADPEELKFIFNVYNQLYQTGEPIRNLVYKTIRKNGEARTLEVYLNLIRKGNEITGFQGTLRDITDRIRAEEALKKSEEKHRTIIESIDDGYFEVDIEGNFVFFNDSMCSILGYSKEEMIGLSYKEYMDEEASVEVYNIFHDVFRTKKVTKVLDREVIKKNKERVYASTSISPILDKEGKVTGFRGVARDITEKKRMENELRKNEENYRSLVENINDVIFNVDSEGNFTFVGPRITDISKYRPEDLIGKPFTRFVYPDDLPILLESLEKTLKGIVDPLEYRIVDKDGEIIFIRSSSRLIKKDGEVMGMTGVITDITEKKKMEEQLIQAEKLSSLGGILSGVAHELNNPLTSIIGNAQILMRRDIPSDIKDKLEVIMKESIRSSKIVGGLLAFAREHKSEKKMIDINEIIFEAYRLREYELRVNDITMNLNLSDDIPETSADPYQLQQVFINLINNAHDALLEKNGGTLDIFTFHKEDNIVIEFKDNGIGISKDNFKKIFDPFFTTKEVGRGTGLGMSIVYGIITDHDGTIDVESEMGQGTRFIIQLPIVKEFSGEEEEEHIRTVEKPKGEIKVLVVEDEESLRDFLVEALEVDGYVPEMARSGEEAIELIEREDYDIIITDMKMPGLSGQSIYNYVKKKDKLLAERMVFITGDILGEETQNFLKLTGARFVEKPFQLDELFSILVDLLVERKNLH